MKALGCFFLLTLHVGYLTDAAGNHADSHHLCKDFVCHNDGQCTAATIHHEVVVYCECKHNFVGQHCETPSCHDTHCQNGGKCHEHQVQHTYKEASCTCPNGYTGSHCERVSVPATTATHSTLFTTTFKTASPSTTYTSTVSTSTPTVSATSTPTVSSTTVSSTTLQTFIADPCSSSPCTRHGTCKIAANGVDFKCHCTAGYHGYLCEHDACDKNQPPCGSGTCVFKHTHPHYRCICPNGYLGHHCEYTVCDTGVCNNGTCQLSGVLPYFSCQCGNGFAGNFCEVPVTTVSPSTVSSSRISITTLQSLISANTCHQNPCGNGTCVTQNTHPYYRCICHKGYLGQHCDLTVCDTGVCNNGSCQLLDTLPYFSCQCGNGFTGNFCEVPVTTISPSTVSTPITSAATLQSLTVNACHQNKPPCVNGTCVTEGAPPYYRCVCDSGYIGPHCDHTVCDIDPCKNGICQLLDTMPYFSCQCNFGFTGVLCEGMLNPTSAPTLSVPFTPTPTKDFRVCDKFNILADVVKGVFVENNMTTCQSGSHASPEAFVIKNCNLTLNAAWQNGMQVMDACKGGKALPSYSPVGTFLNGSYLDALNGGTAGVFLGCLADGGFKLAVQDCDGAPVIKHINGSHFTMDPSMYFSIV